MTDTQSPLPSCQRPPDRDAAPLPGLVPLLLGRLASSLLLGSPQLSLFLLFLLLQLGLLLADHLDDPLHVVALDPPLVLAVLVREDADADAGAYCPVGGLWYWCWRKVEEVSTVVYRLVEIDFLTGGYTFAERTGCCRGGYLTGRPLQGDKAR